MKEKELIKQLFALPRDIQLCLREFGIVQVNQYLVCTNKISPKQLQLFNQTYQDDVIQPIELCRDGRKVYSVNSLNGLITSENAKRREFYTSGSVRVRLSRYVLEYIEWESCIFKEFYYEYVMDQKHVFMTFTNVHDLNTLNCGSDCKDCCDCKEKSLIKLNSTYDELHITNYSID